MTSRSEAAIAGAPTGTTAGMGARVKAAIRGAAGRTNLLLILLLFFLILEYIRPPGLVQLKLQMIISLVLPFLCYRSIRDRRWDRILTLQVALLAFCMTGVVYADNYYAAYGISRVLYTTVFVSISMAWLLARMNFFRRAIWTWILIMTYLGCFGLLMGGTGPGGIIGDENEVALACNTAIPMAGLGAIYARGFRRILCVGITIVLLAAVVVTNSRGGFVGLVALTAYLVLTSKYVIRAIAAVLVAGVVFFAALPPSYRNELLSIKQEATGEIEDGTADARYFLWEAAFNMWKAHPILGVGAGNSRFHTGDFQPKWGKPMYDDRDWSGTAIHSGFFEALSELGSVGIYIYGSMIVGHFTLLRRLRKKARNDRKMPAALRDEIEMYAGALAGGMVGYLVSGLFLSVAYHPYPFYFAALALALGWAVEYERAGFTASPPGPVSPRPAPGPSSPPTARPTPASDGNGGSASLGSGLTRGSAAR